MVVGPFPIMFEKSFVIFVFNKETENFSFSSLLISTTPLFMPILIFTGDLSLDSLHTALLVLRFHSRADAATPERWRWIYWLLDLEMETEKKKEEEEMVD